MNKTYIIVILVILLAASLFIHITNFEIGSSGDELALKKECQEVGKKLYEQDLSNKKSNQSYFEPEYGYSKELDTCLYAGGFMETMGEGETYVDQWVIDSFTNVEIIGYRVLNDNPINPEYCGDTCVSSSEEFNRKKDELLYRN